MRRNLKIAWARFLSKTPEFLVRLQVFFGALAIILGAMIGANKMMELGFKDEGWYVAIKIGAMLCAGIVAGLQFTTKDKNLSDLK
jgi:hypothetical protein